MKVRRGIVLLILLGFLCVVFGTFLRSAFHGPPSISFDGQRYTAQQFFADPKTAALAEASSAAQLEQIDLLVAAGANPNGLGKFGYTPVMWAIQTHSLAGFQRLLELGGRLDIPNSETLSAMGLVAGPSGDSRFLEVALKHGGNPNFVEQSEYYSLQTPLFLAAQSGQTERIEMLLEAGANINARNKQGTTPLHEACFSREYHCAFALLKHGADYRLKGKSGHDFVKTMSIQLDPPWWTPGHWWKRRVMIFVADAEKSLATHH